MRPSQTGTCLYAFTTNVANIVQYPVGIDPFISGINKQSRIEYRQSVGERTADAILMDDRVPDHRHPLQPAA